MKSLVTGGAGFIGSHLVDALLKLGHQVTVLDNFSTGRPENVEHVKHDIDLVECDIGKCSGWENSFRDVDWVFHLAALADIVPSIQNPNDYFRSNVDGTFNVLQAKYLGEELVMHWAKVYELPAVSLRFFNVYGPRSRTSGTYGAVFGVFLAQKLAKTPFTVVGDGSQTRDFTYVSDIVKALITAAESSKTNAVYNVGSGATVSVNRLVELLGGEKIFIPKRPGEPDCTFADISKIQAELGWHPEIAIEQGVSELLEHIEYWRDAPVWTPDAIATATKDWFRYLGSSDSG